MVKKDDFKNELEGLIKSYVFSTNINCMAFDEAGKVLSKKNFYNRSQFCKVIKSYDYSENCKRSYLYGARQAKEIGDAYIYFCPYGLVNWIVPVYLEDEKNIFLTGGPVLIHEVDDILISSIVEQNNLLKTKYRAIKNNLLQIEQVDPTRVKYLSDLLLRLGKGFDIKSASVIQNKSEINKIHAGITEVINNLKKELVENSEEKKMYTFKREKELISKVKLGDKHGAQEILNDILGFLYCHEDFETVKIKSLSLIVILERAAVEVATGLDCIFGIEHIYIKKILATTNLNELLTLLSQILENFMGCVFSTLNVKNKDIIFKAMNYIRNNYQDICLDDVAAEVGLNAAYFSKLFKEELGKSYTEYLNEVRIEESKRYLKRGQSLAEIAQIVGFNDQSYFSKIFKKYEGISPNKWRQKYSKIS